MHELSEESNNGSKEAFEAMGVLLVVRNGLASVRSLIMAPAWLGALPKKAWAPKSNHDRDRPATIINFPDAHTA